ncbi:helix-turn-helix domain-containing protein [Streptomyces pimonensis]|uniref:Helix-turn-helix domain-containing protein n=1 Tax=Streptomyces pimonensis TaxID=2860288 RepID=A0ABV4J7Q7_9ACTN
MADISDAGDWLPVPYVARHLGISTSTAYRWARRGILRARRLGPNGRTVRVHRSALDEHDRIEAPTRA